MAGIIIEPKAEASAVAEPEMPEKNMLETMVTWASPPRIWPTSEREKATMRSVMPHAFINSPAMMKNGIANSVKESTPTKARVTMPLSGRVASEASVTSEAIPSAKAIGTLIKRSTKNVTKRTVSTRSCLPVGVGAQRYDDALDADQKDQRHRNRNGDIISRTSARPEPASAGTCSC